jgi:flagellar motor switch protein FliN/FliY
MDPAMPNLDVVLDVPVQLTVRIGTSNLPMREVLRLESGSIIQLDRTADQPVDLLVNSKLVARGEVVVVENRFGFKLTEVIRGGAPASA